MNTIIDIPAPVFPRFLVNEPRETRSLLRLKRILVPIDFTHLSAKALCYAREFARTFGSRVFLLSVQNPKRREHGPNLDELDARLRQYGERELGRSLRWESLVQLGKPWEEIVRIAQARDVDLIIMPSQSHRGGLRCLNVSSRVSAHAPCPILLVRNPEHDFVVFNSSHENANEK